MRIFIFSDHSAEIATLNAALCRNHCAIIDSVNADMDFLPQVLQTRPDAIVIYVQSPSEKMLQNLLKLDQVFPLPVVLFTQNNDLGKMYKAMEANVSAYIVNGLNEERLKPILDVAMARFAATQKIKKSLKDVESRLQSRKLIEQAKGLVMQQRGCSEQEAYKLLRNTAMNLNKSMFEIAQTLTACNHLLGE